MAEKPNLVQSILTSTMASFGCSMILALLAAPWLVLAGTFLSSWYAIVGGAILFLAGLRGIAVLMAAVSINTGSVGMMQSLLASLQSSQGKPSN